MRDSQSILDYHADILRALLPPGETEATVNAAEVANRLETDIAELLWSTSWMSARGWIEQSWDPATGTMYVRRLKPRQSPRWSFQSPRHKERRGAQGEAKTAPPGHPREHALNTSQKDSQPPILASPSPYTQSTAPLGLGPLTGRIESLDLGAPELPNTLDPLNSPRDQLVKGTSGP